MELEAVGTVSDQAEEKIEATEGMLLDERVWILSNDAESSLLGLIELLKDYENYRDEETLEPWFKTSLEDDSFETEQLTLELDKAAKTCQRIKEAALGYGRYGS